jgi:signal transduction histidine kinase
VLLNAPSGEVIWCFAGAAERSDGCSCGRVINARNAVPVRFLSFAFLRSRRIQPQQAVIALSAVLRRWRAGCATAGAVFALFALITTTLAWLAVRALRRGRFAAASLRRGDARLRRQNWLLQSTLESIGEGLSVFDARGRLIARNRRFCDLLELPTDLAEGTTLREILMYQALRGDFGVVEPQAEVDRRLEQFYWEVPTVKERLTPAGRILQIRRGPMPGGAVVSVYSDITALKASHSKLLEARSQADFANHSKSEFLANMSHELRTPLNAIIGFTEIIAQELFGPIVNEKYLEYVKDVHASSLHLLSIINDVLDMSKIEAGKLELQEQAVTVQDLIAGVIRIVHERASSRGIKLVTEITAEPIVIWADERSMKQVFLNLLSNAIKFSHQGGVVEVRVSVGLAGTKIIEIEDHGIGMDVDEQVRALQPFGQAKPATTRDYGGTGLGLPITKGLVEAHGGTLTIRSRSGEGTMVRLELPTEAGRIVPEGESFARSAVSPIG